MQVSAAALAFDLVLAVVCILWIIGAGFGLRVLRLVPVLSKLSQAGRLPAPVAGPVGPPVDPARTAEAPPLLAILVPASNEAGDAGSIDDLRAAHASRVLAAETLAAAGPDLATEILYIDDRSTDTTGAVLDAFAAAGAAPGRAPVAVRTLHLRELPEGWLGKTHALQRGIEASRGEWLLLTDADVRLGPDALTAALGHAQAQGLDHLVLTPQLRPGGLLRDATLGAFGRIFALNMASVNDPRSKASVGIGAFNLVRRAALLAAGGMKRVRLEVGDDMALGAVLRATGARQGVASGRELVQLTWYRTAGAIVRGLEKGIFAYGGRCEPWRLFLGAALLLALELGPWLAVAVGFNAARGASGAAGGWSLALGIVGATSIVLGVAIVAAGEHWMGRRMLPALLVPIGGLIMAWAVLRAGWMGRRRGGVLWRGTLYPTEMLREAMAWEGGTRGGRRRQE
jgi:hypothetical protein